MPAGIQKESAFQRSAREAMQAERKNIEARRTDCLPSWQHLESPPGVVGSETQKSPVAGRAVSGNDWRAAAERELRDEAADTVTKNEAHPACWRCATGKSKTSYCWSCRLEKDKVADTTPTDEKSHHGDDCETGSEASAVTAKDVFPGLDLNARYVFIPRTEGSEVGPPSRKNKEKLPKANRDSNLGPDPMFDGPFRFDSFATPLGGMGLGSPGAGSRDKIPLDPKDAWNDFYNGRVYGVTATRETREPEPMRRKTGRDSNWGVRSEVTATESRPDSRTDSRADSATESNGSCTLIEVAVRDLMNHIEYFEVDKRDTLYEVADRYAGRTKTDPRNLRFKFPNGDVYSMDEEDESSLEDVSPSQSQYCQ